ncbi:hypothetical protein [Streptomyces atacamensis]|uniref:hypothetical protein n=1 Tax=Streptomyces atacamensis TaxID=531966 RepID=UPI00399D2EA4
MTETTTAEAVETAWPEGVDLRYLTLVGATVDLYDADESHPAACLGCGDSASETDWHQAKAWAQSHAERCRALPRPTTA